MSEDRESVTVDPGGFRKRLREDVSADYELIRGALLRALAAEKEVTLRCDYCKKSSKVPVPDHAAANKAAELYMNAGFGRPESESRVSPEDEAAAKVHKMSDEELTERRMTWLVQRVADGGPALRSQLREKWAPVILEALEAA